MIPRTIRLSLGLILPRLPSLRPNKRHHYSNTPRVASRSARPHVRSGSR